MDEILTTARDLELEVNEGSKRDVPTTPFTCPFSPVFIPQRCCWGLDSRLKQSMQKRTLNDTKFFNTKRFFRAERNPRETCSQMKCWTGQMKYLVRGPPHSNLGDDNYSQVVYI
ncbi:hypothetical protein TNCV_624851 [Trichonephila clavipes]|nr:hypothetical protein TNCV_624851 [Trichonephila clavipes]